MAQVHVRGGESFLKSVVWELSIKLVAGHAAKAEDFEPCVVAPRYLFLPVNTALWSRAAAAATTAKLTRAMAEGARVMARFRGAVSLPVHMRREREGERFLLESTHDKGRRKVMHIQQLPIRIHL